MKVEVEKAIKSPSDHFRHPSEVANAPGMSVDDKVKILKSWEVDNIRRLTSQAENMDGPENDIVTEHLQAIQDTLRLLRGAGTDEPENWGP